MGVWGPGIMDSDGAGDAMDKLAWHIEGQVESMLGANDVQGGLALLDVRVALFEGLGVGIFNLDLPGRWLELWLAIPDAYALVEGWREDDMRLGYATSVADLFRRLYEARQQVTGGKNASELRWVVTKVATRFGYRADQLDTAI